MSIDALHQAADNGDLENVRRLVQEEGVDVDATFLGCDRTALHIAAKCGHSDVVNFLLDNHADANIKDCVTDKTSVMHAVRGRLDFEVLERLVDHTTDINVGNNDGDTALHHAILYRADHKTIQLLLGCKANANAINKTGRTPLHYALRHGAKLEVVQCLLDHGADVNIADRNGRSPLHHGPRGFITTAPVMELLLSHGADLQAKDKDGWTALHALVWGDSIEAVRALLDHLSKNNGPTSTEAVLKSLDKHEYLPFHRSRSLEMMQVLMERSLLEDGDRVVPKVCHEMLFAKTDSGQSLLESQRDIHSKNVRLRGMLRGSGQALFDHHASMITYLASYTNLSLTVPEQRAPPTPCEHHRDKRPRLDATVPLNPNLNAFQRSIANAFLHKWSRSFRRPGGTAAGAVDDEHAMLLPEDLKYVIMAYLSPADIMKM